MRLRRLAPKAVAKDDELVVADRRVAGRPRSRTDAGRRCCGELAPAGADPARRERPR